MAYYLIRVGGGSKYIKEAQEKGFVAVGWNDLISIKNFSSFEVIKSALLEADYHYSQSQAAAQAGQLSRFGLEIQGGDFIISPLGEGKYIIGKAGEYYYEEKAKGECPYKHRRKVEWLNKILLKEDMSTSLSYALGAALTVFSMNLSELTLGVS